MKVSAVILAAGESRRFGQNKLFVLLNEPLLAKALRPFRNNERVEEIVLVINPTDREKVCEILLKANLSARIVSGGKSREESAYLGVKASKEDYVLIHDAARANVSEKAINDVIDKLEEADGVIPIVAETNSITTADGEYLERKSLFAVQTPQGFNKEKLLYSYENAKKPLSEYTDDGSVFAERFPLSTVEGDLSNVKITYPEDVFGIAGELVCGAGYDCHELAEGRKLILGGVRIPYEKGLLGVSDADVVLHALMDAFLNACGLGDIGKYFPPSDPKYKDANSVGLTLKILKIIIAAGYRPNNVSVTILAEKPKLAEYVPQIKANIASICELPVGRVGVGATTTEGLGFVGREEGIACYAVCSLRKIK